MEIALGAILLVCAVVLAVLMIVGIAAVFSYRRGRD